MSLQWLLLALAVTTACYYFFRLKSMLNHSFRIDQWSAFDLLTFYSKPIDRSILSLIYAGSCFSLSSDRVVKKIRQHAAIYWSHLEIYMYLGHSWLINSEYVSLRISAKCLDAFAIIFFIVSSFFSSRASRSTFLSRIFAMIYWSKIAIFSYLLLLLLLINKQFSPPILISFYHKQTFFSIIILAFLNYYELAIALNVLPIDTKDSLEDKLSNGGVVNAKETSLTDDGGSSSSNIGSFINDSNSVSSLNDGVGAGGIVTTGDVIESQTSKNIQAAGKLTTTPSPKLRKEKSDPYECPNTSEFSFFPHYCSRHANCLGIGKEYRCCRQFNSKRCVKGVPKPLKEQRHERNFAPIHFTLIDVVVSSWWSIEECSLINCNCFRLPCHFSF